MWQLWLLQLSSCGCTPAQKCLWICVCSPIYFEWPWAIDSSHLHINLSPALLDSPVAHYLALLSLTSPALSPHLSFILSLPLLFSVSEYKVSGNIHRHFCLWPTINMHFLHMHIQTKQDLRSKLFPLNSMCSLLCCRVPPERGQSSWLPVRSVSQQPRAFPVLPLSTQLPPSNPQGEPWPEGARWWPPHGKCTIRLCAVFFRND